MRQLRKEQRNQKLAAFRAPIVSLLPGVPPPIKFFSWRVQLSRSHVKGHCRVRFQCVALHPCVPGCNATLQCHSGMGSLSNRGPGTNCPFAPAPGYTLGLTGIWLWAALLSPAYKWNPQAQLGLPLVAGPQKRITAW